MKAKDEKTNVMRVLDSKKIKYQHYYYGDTDAISGTDVAKALGQNPECVFKTLVTEGKTKNHCGLVAQLVRAPPCHGGGRGFESHLGR